MIRALVFAFTLLSVGLASAQTFPVNNLNIEGQLQLNGSPGTAGTFLQSNGTSAPTWVTGISSGTTNPNLNYLSSYTGSSTRTYTSKLSDWISVKDFGATGNGAIDDSGAIQVASNSSPVIIPQGNYYIANSITLPQGVQFLPGAYFNIAAGKTVTFNGPVVAGVQQIFSGSGTVVISSAFTPVGYPEWWGALSNNASVDTSTAINLCIATVPVCELQAANYYTTGTILLQRAGSSLQGPFPALSGGPGTANIINQSASATVIQVGPNSYTGTLQNSNSVSNLSVGRSVGPLIGAQANGVLVQYTIYTAITGVLVQDSGVGFHIRGTGQAHFFRDYVYRATPGTGTGTDQLYGFWADGSVNIGFAGGNASLYIDNSAVSSGVTWTSALDYQGFVASGAYGYSDIFLKNFETAALGIGLNLQGNSNAGTTADIQNEDVLVYNLGSDGNGIAGILIANTSIYGAIQIIGGYVNFNGGASTPVGLSMSGSNGSVVMTGVEFMCIGNTTAEGMVISNSRGLNSYGNNFFECNNIPVTLTGVSHSSFADQIRAFSRGSTNQPAVFIHNSSTRNIFREIVEGAASAYSQGYYIGDSTTSFSEYNASGLDQAAIANSKINNNGTGVTAVGTFGTSNYAVGVMN
jgi:hypothetical protein